MFDSWINFVSYPTIEGVFYDIYKDNSFVKDSRKYSRQSNVYLSVIELDEEAVEHTRNSYDLLSLLGDTGGVFDLLIFFFGVLLYQIPSNISTLSIAKNYFDVDDGNLDK